MLVTKINDYYTKGKPGILNTTISKNLNYNVGVIVHVGDDLPEQWIRKIIYYHKNIGVEINLSELGEYDLVPVSAKLIIRMDQEIKITNLKH